MKLSIPVLLPLWVLLGPALAWASTAQDNQQDTFAITLPRGQVEAGRKAFVQLSCTSCHAVSGEDFGVPVSAHPGPTLNSTHAAHAQLDLGGTATAIVSPSHTITTHVDGLKEGNLSPMGDYTDAMTLRQLVDLLAYIRSLDGGH